MTTQISKAHEWYDPECCNEQDCAPAKEGELIRFVDRNGVLGWLVNVPSKGIRQFVPDSSEIIRKTPSHAKEPHHICIFEAALYSHPGAPGAEENTAQNELLCIYIRESFF